MLSANSDKPLIIDQPEDNLDGEFIYSTLVPVLRRAKERRQVTHPLATHAVMPTTAGRQAYLIDARSDAWMGQQLFDMRKAILSHRVCISPKLYLQRHNPSALALIEDIFTKLDGKGRCIVPWWVAQFKASTPEVKEVFFGLDSAYCAENLRLMDEQEEQA